MVGQRVDVGVGVHVRDVAHVVALRLQPVHEMKFKEEVVAGSIAIAGTEGTIEGDLGGMGIWKGTFKRRAFTVRADTSPEVVGLIGGHASLEENIFAAPVVTHDEEDKARVTRGGGQLGQVDAGDPVGGDLQGGGLGPTCAGDHAGDRIGIRDGLVDAGETGQGGNQAGTDTLIVASAEDIDGEAGSGGGHIEVDGITMVDADLGAETRYEIVLQGGGKVVPARSTRLAVLDLYGVLSCRGSGSLVVWDEKGTRSEQERDGDETEGQEDTLFWKAVPTPGSSGLVPQIVK